MSTEYVSSNKEELYYLPRLVCSHRNEWSYNQDPALDKLGDEIDSLYDKLIKEEAKSELKEKLTSQKQERINITKEWVKNLGFWDKIKIDTTTDKDGFALKAFPSLPYVYHFNPIAFVEQMKRYEGVLEKIKKIVDTHIPYSQLGERSADTGSGWKNLDCSELVMRYLYELGIMGKTVWLTTASMTSESAFRKVLNSNDIDFVTDSNKSDFIPQKGDIFVWRNGDGHTGIVYEYDSSNDLVTILEAVGSGGSADSGTNRNNGGYDEVGCTRTAVFKRTGGALSAHAGWIGYFRPKNYQKEL